MTIGTSTRGLGLLSIALGAAALITACTLATNETTTQCRSQADCLARGPDYANTTCSAERVCTKIVVADKACTKNQECSDKAGGAPVICRKSDGVCVNLLTDECPVVYADKSELLNDATVFIGTTTPSVEVGVQANIAVQLARKEINKAGGLPPTTPGGPRRPIGIVSCANENLSVATAEAQYKHLAQTVRVPFATGTMVGTRSLLAARTYSSNGVLSIGTSDIFELSDVDKNLVFRSAFSELEATRSMGKSIEYLTPIMLAAGDLQPGEQVRVAVTRDLLQGGGIATGVSRIKLNGMDALDPGNKDNFQIFDSGTNQDPVNHPNPEAEINVAVQRVLAFKPHFLFITGGPGQIANIYIAIMRLWPAGVPRPYVVPVIPSVSTLFAGVISGALGNLGPVQVEQMRKKIWGIRMYSPDVKQSEIDRFVAALRTGFPDVTIPITFNVPAFYDEIYLFAYSAAAIGNAPLTGIELSRGLRRVAGAGGGVPITWGPADFSKAMAALAAGSDLSYIGVQGSFGFDGKGDHPGISDIYCIPASTATGKPVNNPTSTGLTYDAKTDTLSGAYSCPAAP